MLKLKLQYFGHMMRRTDSLEKTLILGKIKGRRRKGQQRMRWLDGITDAMDKVWINSGSWWWTGKPGVLQSMGSQRVRHNWETELNWRFGDDEDRMQGLRRDFSGGQWLRIYLPKQRIWAPPLVGELRSHMTQDNLARTPQLMRPTHRN